VQLTPSQAFEHIKEQFAQYLETAYKISQPDVFAERGELLRERGTIAQAPFIEATPAFPTARKLVELEHAYPEVIPQRLSELIQYGVPVDRFNLYTHQEESLLRAYSDQPNLLVATGTGSGKTECFLLPILSDILREAYTWPEVSDNAQPGRHDAVTNEWLHARRHETRPAGLRAIILYPMNALVNDQLSRLRRILSRDESPDWQRRNLKGNVIHFGMYTGLTQPTGSYTDKWRRDKFNDYRASLEEDWQKLRKDLRDSGSWPRPNSPEMLCRWDMQQAPPDILVTNYSMLEYMLVRPIEFPIFELTRQWLAGNPEARFTLVLDEAHTYTGALGTEVAHLVRRLKERLDIQPNTSKFRAIATTASVPPGGDDKLRAFTSDLFGEPAQRFSLIRIGAGALDVPQRTPTALAFNSFAQFQDAFNIQEPYPAIDQLAANLQLGPPDHTEDPQVALYRMLETNQDIIWVRQRTARNATLFDQLADECWGDMGTRDERERALSGVLAAGSFARPSASQDTPPLLSMRVHAFFRGISGVWACMNPDCPEVPGHFRADTANPRALGKIYFDPRPWCSPACGGRVLELFSCRKCGLLFLGGIPDERHGSLWPWSDDLSGERQDLNLFQIFGVERPFTEAQPTHRSIRTTLETHPAEPTARPVYEVDPAQSDGRVVGPFPSRCPRCQNYRAPTGGREIIEPLRTRGPRSFSIVAEDGFRVQPRAAKGNPPNYGRKALIFTDSRLEAAQLAADIRRDHHKDLFRQILYRVLHSCRTCSGRGYVEQATNFVFGQDHVTEPLRVVCPDCEGARFIQNPPPVGYRELATRVISLQLELGINPTSDIFETFFSHLALGDQECEKIAALHFDLSLRRELSEDEVSLEPLGLASWRIQLPEQIGSLEPLTEEEIRILLRSTARILATEHVLLPPEPLEPWAWSRLDTTLIKPYERNVLIWANRKSEGVVPYNLSVYRKLGRYAIALSKALLEAKRFKSLADSVQWLETLRTQLWSALRAPNFRILTQAGAKIRDDVPYGIRLDRFELHAISNTVHKCTACAYIMSETLFNVCIRCGQMTQEVDPSSLRNFYRLAAQHALLTSGFDDPYPLRSIEHTAQVAGDEARNIERWFQDMFHDDQHPNDHRIDILSVTTTMEMGIDIGSLLSVGLRNIPPTVANYQQRAGRAGRRGSSIATVLSFSQFRSHDQYYFSRPPEIVSNPPRVPALYMQNDVIARRHIRSLVLQSFFHNQLYGSRTSGLFGTWGTIADYINRQTSDKLHKHLAGNRIPVLDRCKRVVHPTFHDKIDGWLDALVDDVHSVVSRREGKEDLLEQLINSGLLPKYAFPVDVVSLNIPSMGSSHTADSNSFGTNNEVMQRDRKIAISEYAPGAEVIRGEFPNTYIYRSAAVYDSFSKNPDYSPTGTLLECGDCQAVLLLAAGQPQPDTCPECDSFKITPLPYLTPPGFTVDCALPNFGRERYESGGRERAGITTPARLMVGASSFAAGVANDPIAPRLYSRVRVGDLFACNKGPNRDFPGFIICPTCGRALEEDQIEGTHTYPANIPPHWGPNRGPRAGTRCPNRGPVQNQVILGDPFHSEIILLGADLPDSLDAPFSERSGQAVWYSFGTLLSNAATITLQINPGELKVGVRPIRRTPSRIHGEVFIYDDVPGGAGYAHAIQQNLPEILQKALEIGEICSNALCSGACYHCMYDYRNQALHPILDRELGSSLLRFLLEGQEPTLDYARVEKAAVAFQEYARDSWQVLPGADIGNKHFPLVLEDKSGGRVGLWVIHALQSPPSLAERQAILAEHGLKCAVHTLFDLERRPFWVLQNLIR
jgi:Lhr-like helicase